MHNIKIHFLVCMKGERIRIPLFRIRRKRQINEIGNLKTSLKIYFCDLVSGS